WLVSGASHEGDWDVRGQDAPEQTARRSRPRCGGGHNPAGGRRCAARSRRPTSSNRRRRSGRAGQGVRQGTDAGTALMEESSRRRPEVKSFVLDASVAVAWCFDDESTPAAWALLDRIRAAAGHVPALWAQEVGNILLGAERR